MGVWVAGSKERTPPSIQYKAGSGCSRPTAAVSTQPSSRDFVGRDIEQNKGPNPEERECHLHVRNTSSPDFDNPMLSHPPEPLLTPSITLQ